MTSPALHAALIAPVVHVFFAVEAIAPTFTLRLIDGASEVTFPVPDPETGELENQTFKGSDETLGALGALETITEGLGNQAPRLRLYLRPPSLAAAATLMAPTNQGARVRMWFGALDLTTGAVIDPEEVFTGEVDVPRYTGGRERRVEWSVFSAWEYLFTDGEGERLNHAQHIKAFPGEMGLEWVSDIERQLPWGGDVPKSRAVSSAQGTSGGRTGGGGGFGGQGGGGSRDIYDVINGVSRLPNG